MRINIFLLTTGLLYLNFVSSTPISNRLALKLLVSQQGFRADIAFLRGGAASTDIMTATTKSTTTTSSSTLRSSVFPIYGDYEVKKFVLLSMTKFFIVFVLTLTRDSKDTLIVNEAGAEAIAFLKVYGVIPAATMFIAIYGRMSKVLRYVE